jgi:hypothetical protein
VRLFASTRGLRADWSAGAEAGTDGPLTGGFDLNSASAAWRARVICSRSSPPGRGCLLAADKDLLQVGDPFRDSGGRFVNFGTPDVGSWESIRKLSLLPQARAPQKRITFDYGNSLIFQSKSVPIVLTGGPSRVRDNKDAGGKPAGYR